MVKYREIVRVFDRLKQYKKSSFEGIFSIWIYYRRISNAAERGVYSFLYLAQDREIQRSGGQEITVKTLPDYSPLVQQN